MTYYADDIETSDEILASVIYHKSNAADKRHKQLHIPVPPDAQKPAVIEEAEKALSAAIIQLLTRQPFFGQLLCSQRQVPTWSMPTMGVDGTSLYFNPSFVMALSKPERRGVLCHEVLHLALRHIARKRQRAGKLWNCACDYAVNAVIKDDLDMQLPEWVLYRADLREKSAEEIFRTLSEEKQNGGGKGKKGQGGGKKQKGQGQKGMGDQSAQGDGGDEDGEGDGHGGDPNCPFCQNGDGDDEMDSFDAHIFNPDLDEDALTDKIVRAAEQAKRRGKLPASIERMVEKLREAKVDWRKIIRGRSLDVFQKVDYHGELRSLLTGSVCGGRTWLPGLAKEEAAVLVLAVDTSGSITPALLNAFASEIKEVMTMADKTIIISCDAAVHEVVEVAKFDSIFDAIKFKGGGGTDFRPVFEKIKQLDIEPNMLVYFTDGYGCFPDSAPDYPTLWAFTTQHAPAPWGESVTVQDTD